MLDIKLVRTNADAVRAGMAKRGKNMDQYIDEVIAIDEQRREISSAADAMKAEQNKVSKMIPQMKKEGKDTTELFAKMKQLSADTKANEEKLLSLMREQNLI